MISLFAILVIGALIAAIASAMGKCPLWVSVIILCIVEFLRVIPL